MGNKSELIEIFLNDYNNFEKSLTKTFDKIPIARNTNNKDFWMFLFIGSALTILNSELRQNVKSICYSITNNNILRLAFNFNNKIILRSISIGFNDEVHGEHQFSRKDLDQIKTLFSYDKIISLKSTCSKHIHIKIIRGKTIKKPKISVICTDNIEETRKDNASSKFINVNPLDMKGKTLDMCLKLISQPTDSNNDDDNDDEQDYTENVEQLFNCFKDLYKQGQWIFGTSESRYHGFVYGALVLNFRQKYSMDVYVEQSAGRGYLDLYLLCKHYNHNQIANADAIKIISEFKNGNNKYPSVADAIKQVEDRCYAQLIGRTQSNKTIIVGADFGDITKQVQAKFMLLDKLPERDFITFIADSQTKLSKANIKEEIRWIFKSTRAEESLAKILLGELLSSKVQKKFAVFLNKIDNDETKASIFILKQFNNNIILSTIEKDDKPLQKYCRLGSTRLQSKHNKEVNVTDEVEYAVRYIQKQYKINSGTKITIIVNRKGQNYETYLESVDITNLNSNPSDTDVGYNIKDYITQPYNIKHSIDVCKLILELRPDIQDDKLEELAKLQCELCEFQAFITEERDFQAILHGLFSFKKFEENTTLRAISEVTFGTGKADLVLASNHSILYFELALLKEHNVDTLLNKKKQQLDKYLVNAKVITNDKNANGVVLIFDSKTGKLYNRYHTAPVEHSSDEGGKTPIYNQIETLEPRLLSPIDQNSPTKAKKSKNSHNEEDSNINIIKKSKMKSVDNFGSTNDSNRQKNVSQNYNINNFDDIEGNRDKIYIGSENSIEDKKNTEVDKNAQLLAFVQDGWHGQEDLNYNNQSASILSKTIGLDNIPE
ncbi:hypothetical protein [Orientia tsutsugamushi]|uniref:Uncharacterized protein n=1 Tax=Orientia tsutsugamushi TaxID=784 RepID=A0A2U3RQK8_ORITS|nr:hypothetical protein [Orientia tsutsugamushi]KJV53935.1 hypothetical protein OTSKARP_1180 [Orientia tsutsugamushi str. Karp]SPR15472.1 Uncharacterised protein [Orientia tsutsugamushi]